ncbi:PLP-dependent aminotransferase family protein [Paracoccaceae bacterium GXU_MW_L88]
MWTPKLESGVSKPTAIVRALRRAIESGELRANDRLPPQRELAYALGVNLSTITRAINEATKEGLVSGEVGRGTFIMPASEPARLFAETIGRSDMIDLSTIVPPLIIGEKIAKEMHRVIDEEEDLFRYPSPQHLQRAREAVRDWLRWRGMERPDFNIALTVGAQAALHAVIGSVMRSGQTLLTEEFTFPGIKTVAQLTGVRLHGVGCDHEGLLPDALEQACRMTGAKVLVAVPNMQNPTGTVMRKARRAEIAKVIAKHGITLIEDDVYGSYAEEPPLATEVTGEHIIISSLSKCVSPALRFGFVAGNHPIVKNLEADPATTSWFASAVPLLVATRFLLSQEAMRMAEMQSREVQERWRLVQRFFPSAPDMPATHLWLSVDNANDYTKRAQDRGVGVVTSSHFSTSRRREDFVRCSITSEADSQRLSQGLAILKSLGATPVYSRH